jgi:hypothetical protein
MTSKELTKYISKIESFPRYEVSLNEASKEFFLNILDSFDINNTAQFGEYLTDLIEANKIEIAFKRKYEDIVYHSNVADYLVVMNYIADEILKHLREIQN